MLTRGTTAHGKKTDTARYKLERMIELSNDELKAVYYDESRPLFERKLATFILKGDWKTYRDEKWFTQHSMVKKLTEQKGHGAYISKEC